MMKNANQQKKNDNHGSQLRKKNQMKKQTDYKVTNFLFISLEMLRRKTTIIAESMISGQEFLLSELHSTLTQHTINVI